MYEAKRPRANVRMPTIEAVVDKGESPQDKMVGAGAEGVAIRNVRSPLSGEHYLSSVR